MSISDYLRVLSRAIAVQNIEERSPEKIVPARIKDLTRYFTVGIRKLTRSASMEMEQCH